MLEQQLKSLVDEVKQETRQQAIKVYSHISVETDFSIHIYNNSKRVEISGSALCQRLASALKEFGLVNHSVWVAKFT